jgi:hypothetical protein
MGVEPLPLTAHCHDRQQAHHSLMLAYLKSSSRPPGMSGALLLVSYCAVLPMARSAWGTGYLLSSVSHVAWRCFLLRLLLFGKKCCWWLLQAVLGTIQLYHAKVGQ